MSTHNLEDLPETFDTILPNFQKVSMPKDSSSLFHAFLYATNEDYRPISMELKANYIKVYRNWLSQEYFNIYNNDIDPKLETLYNGTIFAGKKLNNSTIQKKIEFNQKIIADYNEYPGIDIIKLLEYVDNKNIILIHHDNNKYITSFSCNKIEIDTSYAETIILFVDDNKYFQPLCLQKDSSYIFKFQTEPTDSADYYQTIIKNIVQTCKNNFNEISEMPSNSIQETQTSSNTPVSPMYTSQDEDLFRDQVLEPIKKQIIDNMIASNSHKNIAHRLTKPIDKKITKKIFDKVKSIFNADKSDKPAVAIQPIYVVPEYQRHASYPYIAGLSSPANRINFFNDNITHRETLPSNNTQVYTQSNLMTIVLLVMVIILTLLFQMY